MPGSAMSRTPNPERCVLRSRSRRSSRWSLIAPAAASAHPLGNFSVNHLARVSVSADRVDVRYILDEAEIPTFQQRDVRRRDGAGAQAGRGRAAARADRRRPPRRAAPRRPRDDHAPGGTGRAAHDPRRAPAVRARRRSAAGRGARRHVPGPRRLEGDRRRSGPRHRGALDVPAGDPDERPAHLPGRPAEEPVGRARRAASTRRPAPGRSARRTARAASPAPNDRAPSTG